jgi:transposase
MPAPVPIEVTASQQRELNRIVNAKTSSQREVFRARIILGLARGLSHEEIANEQSVSLLAIGRWRKRFAARGLEGLKDAPGRGRKPQLSAKAVGRALSLARTRAPHGGPWSVRTMARETGLSKSSVQRLWSAHELQHHRCALSSSPRTCSLRKSSGTWWVSTSIRPIGPWCSAAMKRANVRPSNAPSPACLWAKGIFALRPTTITGMAR